MPPSQQPFVSRSRGFALTLTFHGVQAGNLPLDDRVSVNGHLLDQHLTSVLGPVGSQIGGVYWNTFQVPIEYLKFPHRTAGQVSAEVTNGVPNVISIIPNYARFPTGSDGLPACGLEERNPRPLYATIEFNALAPTVMVHGIRATEKWFDDYQYSPRGPLAYTNRGFKQAFIDAKAPYKALHFDEALIRVGGTNVSVAIKKAADEFGAQHVHIVAHSMGGLWSRQFLAEGPPVTANLLGVYSLTTLDTPHLGSFNADLRMLLSDNRWNPFFSYNWDDFFTDMLAPASPGMPELTVAAVYRFNQENRLPSSTTVGGQRNKVWKYSVSSDANIDNSCEHMANNGGAQVCDSAHRPTITQSPSNPDESEGYEYPDPDVSRYSPFLVGQKLYRQMFRYWIAELDRCGPFGIQSCIHLIHVSDNLNDFQVTLESARYPGFIEISSSKHNHTTVGQNTAAQPGQPDTSLVVLQKIVGSQTMLP